MIRILIDIAEIDFIDAFRLFIISMLYIQIDNIFSGHKFIINNFYNIKVRTNLKYTENMNTKMLAAFPRWVAKMIR